jgi:phospholipase C
MMENRSFDHVLGFLSHEKYDARGDVDGLHEDSTRFDWGNPDAAGKPFQPTATADSYLPGDMPHSRDQIAAQLAAGSMLGFVQSYHAFAPVNLQPIPMRFCRPDDIPITAAFARNYSVCDRWFASLPDDTFPNRLMSVSGYTNIDSTSVVKPPFDLMPDQTTIFDWLGSKGKSYKIYVDAQPIDNLGPPASLVLMKSQWKNLLPNTHTLDTLAKDWQSSAAAPAVIYCEPFFNDFATAIGMHGNCNHPPLPMAPGEAFLRTVYTALTANPAKWRRTMMILCYDEHGGFFDHVTPPAIDYPPPPGSSWSTPQPFTSFGVRIPGIVISPLVDRATAFHGQLDHTSILQLMVDKFGSPDDLAFFGHAPARKAAGVRSLAATLTRTSPRTDDIVALPPAPASAGTPVQAPLSNVGRILQTAIARAKP